MPSCLSGRYAAVKVRKKLYVTDTPEFGDYLVLMHAVMREENDCRWLERCVELCGGEDA